MTDQRAGRCTCPWTAETNYQFAADCPVHSDVVQERDILPEWKCPSCGATTRARLADKVPEDLVAELAKLRVENERLVALILKLASAGLEEARAASEDTIEQPTRVKAAVVLTDFTPSNAIADEAVATLARDGLLADGTGRRRIETALALHRRDEYGDCVECGVDTGENPIPWPCPTVAALTDTPERVTELPADGVERTVELGGTALKTCPAHPGHAPFNALYRCPWCEIERLRAAMEDATERWIKEHPPLARGVTMHPIGAIQGVASPPGEPDESAPKGSQP